ncbi:MAG TPA: sugar kinase, partial [Salinimicrobium sp.]|nr:sugar kinase [Salinimicrobium sp.]
IYGSALASFCVERFGTERMTELSRKEIHERMEEFKALTQFEIKLT